MRLEPGMEAKKTLGNKTFALPNIIQSLIPIKLVEQVEDSDSEAPEIKSSDLSSQKL